MAVDGAWLGGPALAWAVIGGGRAGGAGAIVIGGFVVALRHLPAAQVLSSTDLDGPVILLMAAMLAGYIAKLTKRAEQAMLRATEIEAASRERARPGRTVPGPGRPGPAARPPPGDETPRPAPRARPDARAHR